MGGALAVFGFLRMIGIFYQFSVGEAPIWISHSQFVDAQWNTAIAGLSAAISFLCGVFILEGANWARWVFACKWALLVALVSLTFFPTRQDGFPLAFLILIQGPMVIILFLRRANRFFTTDL